MSHKYLTGRKSSIGTTAVAITDRDVAVSSPTVKIKASSANGTDLVFVGESSGVTPGTTDGTSGYPVGPAGAEIEFPTSLIPGRRLANLYVVGSAPGLAVFWACEGYEPPL